MTRRMLIKSVVAASATAALRPRLLLAAPQASTAASPQAQSVTPPAGDIEQYPNCDYCGMDRKKFNSTRMLIPYADGKVDGLCSLRCAVSSLTLNIGRGAQAIWVGDNASSVDPKPLTDAQAAVYLVGSSLPGVMTKRSKVAYRTREAAAAARTAHGGDVLGFDETLAAAYADVAESVSANLKKRRSSGGGLAEAGR